MHDLTSRVRPRRALGLALALVSFVLVAAFGGGPVMASSATLMAMSSRASAPPPGSTYVALGSSFASGFGLPVQGPTCGRSDHNYGHLVATSLELELVDVTCGGATTATVTSTQLSAVTADTALVTMTLGGNDLQYSASTLICQGSSNCLPSLPKKAISDAVVTLPGKIEKLIATVETQAPNATVVLVTYPQVVSPHGASCKTLRLAPNEAKYLHRLGQRLENVFLKVAKATDVVLVDPYRNGHGPCAAPDKQWVAGATAPGGFPDHPTLKGHSVMATLILAALQPV